jgi:hypothetical protein
MGTDDRARQEVAQHDGLSQSLKDSGRNRCNGQNQCEVRQEVVRIVQSESWP